MQPLLGDRVCFSSGPRLQPVLPEPGIPTEAVILLGPLSQGPSLTAVPCFPRLLFNLEDLGYCYNLLVAWCENSGDLHLHAPKRRAQQPELVSGHHA